MSSSDPRIDAYIAKAAPFARPILERLRELVHAACPEVEETIKWGMPHFLHAGKMLCGMAAFKQHCAFGFWRAEAMPASERKDEAMGQLGRISSLKDLPSPTRMKTWVKAAIAAQAAARATPKRKAAATANPYDQVPDDLAAALRGHATAKRHFEAFPPSARREYVEWLLTAKQAATRQRRLEQSIAWLNEGKRRHWKYAAC